MDNALNNQQETNTAEGKMNNQQQEKLFTQADLDRIIGERLARVKTETSPEIQAREQKCTQRELRLDARERLADAGLPKELLSAINCSTKEDMENSIKVIQSIYGSDKEPSKTAYRVTGGASTGKMSTMPGQGYNYRSGVDNPASIRAAMGLKG